MQHTAWVRWMVSMVVSILLSGALEGSASAQDLRRIVVFEEGTPVDVQQQVVTLSGSKVLHILSLVNALGIELPAVGTEAALASLQAPPVERVEGDPVLTLQGAGSDGVFITPSVVPADEFYPWGIDWIGAADVQELYPGLTGKGVKVALIDTGIDPTHPDLKWNVIGGYNAMAGQNPSNWPDDNGHGTHVAGTLAAGLDQQGVIGVAPRSRIYAFKALDRDGKGRTSDVINALQRVPPDVRIIAGSFGTDLVWPSFETAIYRMYQSGKLMVFSVGNRCAPDGAQGAGSDGAGSDGAGSDASCNAILSDVKFPARFPWVIAVGASDANDLVPAYSRSGPAMTDHGVVAPGVNIFSTDLAGGYGRMSGTSASTPHVTGAIALACQLQPGLSYEELLALLQETAEDLGYTPEYQGAGRINVEKLVHRLRH